MMQLVFRFVVGGTIVSAFSILGDQLKPKSFAGLLGAAPSVALATLGLTILTDGKLYAAQESRSMIAGSFAFFLYASLCSRLMMRYKLGAALVTISLLSVWFVCALGGWLLFLR